MDKVQMPDRSAVAAIRMEAVEAREAAEELVHEQAERQVAYHRDPARFLDGVANVVEKAAKEGEVSGYVSQGTNNHYHATQLELGARAAAAILAEQGWRSVVKGIGGKENWKQRDYDEAGLCRYYVGLDIMLPDPSEIESAVGALAVSKSQTAVIYSVTKPIFIAEVKTESPFGWKSEKSWDELFDIANDHGDWLSIHTDYRWGGSFDLIEIARARTDKPILAKGVHSTNEEIKKAVENGADHVLVVGRVPGVYQERCLIEPLDVDQIFDFSDQTRLVWNQRNLASGRSKNESFDDVRKIWPGWLAQASFITAIDEVSPLAEAYIVGTHLPEFVTSLCRDK